MVRRKVHLHLSNPQRQKGAAGVLSIFVLGSALLCAALALDAARLYWEAQELQHIADIAALDVASDNNNIFNGLLIGDEALQALNALAQNSINRNLPNENWNLTATVKQLGVQEASGIRTSCSASTCPAEVTHYNAIEVSVSKEVCASLIVNLSALFPQGNYQSPTNGNCLTPSSRLIVKKAVARPSLFIGLTAQTSLLNLCSDDSLLMQALLTELAGSSLCIAIINNQNILEEQLTLLDLQNEILPISMNSSAATMEALLSTEVSIGQLVDFAAASIRNPPPALNPNEIADALNTNNHLSTFDLTLADIFEVDRTINDSYEIRNIIETEFKFGALLETAMLLAHKCQTVVDHTCLNGQGAIIVPASSVELAGQVKLQELRLNIMQAPKIAIGPVGCADGSIPATSEPGCARWRTEAHPAQISLNTDFSVNLGDLLNVELQLSHSGISGYAGISNTTRIENSDNYNIAVGGYTELLSSAPGANSVTINVSLLPVIEQVSVIEGLLNDLLGLLNLKQLISVEPIDLEITNAITLPISNGGEVIEWPQQTSTTIGLSTQPYAFEDISSNLTMNVRNCIVNVVGIELCGAIHREDISISLNDLLPAGTDLVQILTNSLNDHVSPLLNALGIDINPMRIDVHSVNAPVAPLVI